MAGNRSEMTSITQYLYHSWMLPEKRLKKATASKNGGTGCRKYLGCCPEWMQKSAELSADLPRPNAGLIAAVQVRETYPGM